ncbi:MAG: hypothetical protein AB7P08_18010 [Burkholderiales bacterium]
MDTIKNIDLLDDTLDARADAKPEAAKAELRSLGDWELALVGGGDGIPVWP